MIELEQQIYEGVEARIDDRLYQYDSNLKKWEETLVTRLNTALLQTLKGLQPPPTPIWQSIVANIISGISIGLPLAVIYYFLK